MAVAWVTPGHQLAGKPWWLGITQVIAGYPFYSDRTTRLRAAWEAYVTAECFCKSDAESLPRLPRITFLGAPWVCRRVRQGVAPRACAGQASLGPHTSDGRTCIRGLGKKCLPAQLAYATYTVAAPALFYWAAAVLVF